jgi:hypothetical protein
MRLRVNAIGVGGVFDECCARSAAISQPGANVCRTPRQQGPVVTECRHAPSGRHGAQARQAGTTAQGQQQGLDLVIGMLGNGYACLATF